MLLVRFFRLTLFVFILATVQPNNTDSNKLKNERYTHYLYKNLLKSYDKEMKPSDSVEIKFALNLNQIVTLIEREQILVINVYLDHEWIDKRLKWNPNEYNNITQLRINSEKLWT